jgi:hypothetical protein
MSLRAIGTPQHVKKDKGSGKVDHVARSIALALGPNLSQSADKMPEMDMGFLF